jgi:hypothetical protein
VIVTDLRLVSDPNEKRMHIAVFRTPSFLCIVGIESEIQKVSILGDFYDTINNKDQYRQTDKFADLVITPKAAIGNSAPLGRRPALNSQLQLLGMM